MQHKPYGWNKDLKMKKGNQVFEKIRNKEIVFNIFAFDSRTENERA